MAPEETQCYLNALKILAGKPERVKCPTCRYTHGNGRLCNRAHRQANGMPKKCNSYAAR